MQKKGISLIVLVITIIIMIIIAGAIILNASNEQITDKAKGAVSKTNEANAKNMAATLWSEAFTKGKKTQSEFYEYISTGLAEMGFDTSLYKIDVSLNGVDVKAYSTLAEEWIATGNIVELVDGVPVPKGFTASYATGENTKEEGLVIYETTQEITNANVEQAKREYNQYVWVPVEDFEGFKRDHFGVSNVEISEEQGIEGKYWEALVDTANLVETEKNHSLITSTTKTEMKAMYESVQKYGGFYIARYEAGLSTARTGNTTLATGSSVQSKMNKYPYIYIGWGNASEASGAVSVARTVYKTTNTNYGVVSTLVYGVQWDAVNKWLLSSGYTNAELLDSILYGNYKNSTYTSTDLNTGAEYAVFDNSTKKLGSFAAVTAGKTKTETDMWQLTTGALEAAKVKNIYDMAGNANEWTMERCGEEGVVRRGGSFANASNAYPIVNRIGTSKYSTTGGNINSFRLALYIK